MFNLFTINFRILNYMFCHCGVFALFTHIRSKEAVFNIHFNIFKVLQCNVTFVIEQFAHLLYVPGISPTKGIFSLFWC